MSFTRGFSGRGRANRDKRLPPGQYDTGSEWPVLTAEVTPKLSTDTWTFTVEGLVEAPDHLDLGPAPRLSAFDLQRRHPLRDHLVEVGA